MVTGSIFVLNTEGLFQANKQYWRHIVHKYNLEDVTSQETSKLSSAIGSNGVYYSLVLHDVMQSAE